MRRPTRLLLIPALVALVAGTAAAQDQFRSGQRASLTARHVEIYDVVGRITMRSGSGNAVTVTATAAGPDGGQLQFLVDRDTERAVFRVVYPDVDRIAGLDNDGGRTTLRLRRDGTFGGGDTVWRGRRGRRGDGVEVGGGSGFRGSANLEITVPRGQRVTLHLAVGSVTIDRVDGTVTIDTWSANARATDIAGEWMFDTGSGDAEVRGMTGTLRIDTGSGSGTVSGMRGDLLDIDTGSGGVDVSDAQVERCRFDTGSGGVRAIGITARRCVADTGSGSVRLDYAGGTIDDLVVDTGSGSVNLGLPRDVNARMTIDTGSGGVNLEREGAMFERRGGEGMVLRFGEGRGRISIDTGSGGVTIR